MLRTLQTAKQAMHLDQARIDTLANNLANVATTGFRQVLNRVTEVGGGGVDNPGADGLPQPENAQKASRDGSWPVARNLQMGQALDVRGGALRDTGRDTHAALSGRGFFVVRDQEGRAHKHHADPTDRDESRPRRIRPVLDRLQLGRA